MAHSTVLKQLNYCRCRSKVSDKSQSNVIDSNILINFKHFCPISIHEAFWFYLSQEVAKDKIIILDRIADELRVKSDSLCDWVNKQKITPVDERVKAIVLEIERDFSLVDYERSKADPYVIAYAKEHNCQVFSFEQKKRKGEKRDKMPDVCESLEVKYESYPENVFAQIGFPIIPLPEKLKKTDSE